MRELFTKEVKTIVEALHYQAKDLQEAVDAVKSKQIAAELSAKALELEDMANNLLAISRAPYGVEFYLAKHEIVNAIKAYREAYGTSLQVSKRNVEAIAQDKNYGYRNEANGEWVWTGKTGGYDLSKDSL